MRLCFDCGWYCPGTCLPARGFEALHSASRHQASEHSAGRKFQSEGLRFRHGEVYGQRYRKPCGDSSERDAGVHGAPVVL